MWTLPKYFTYKECFENALQEKTWWSNSCANRPTTSISMPSENTVKEKMYWKYTRLLQATIKRLVDLTFWVKNLLSASPRRGVVQCAKKCAPLKRWQDNIWRMCIMWPNNRASIEMGMIYCIIRFVSLIGLNKLKLCVLASSDLDREVGALMRRGEKGGWLCVSCGFTSTIRARLWEHVESAHTQSTGYSCPTCEKFCSSFNAYKIHKSRYHKQNLNQ